MPKLNEDYYLRKHYLETEQVPTQTVMKNKMTPPLADVYFKSMTPKLKVLAGLEPPMKGGGSDWFVPPKELLGGRAVLKPMKKQFLSKLGFNGIDYFGEKIVRDHRDQMEKEKRIALNENDINWKNTVEKCCREHWDVISAEQSKQNTCKIQQAFDEFTALYMTSINKIESLLFDASIKEIERVKDEAFIKMSAQYETLLKQQSTMLYDRYANNLAKEKARLKDNFITEVEKCRTEMGNKLHDINLEKHVAVEKLRVLLKCQNLACQVYVALKERGECSRNIEISKHEHEKKMKILSRKVQTQDFEIQLAKAKEKKRKDFITVWQKKVCHVVKRFQDFVKYCLHTLPEHADFFINMEKLMLLQLSEAIDNPSAESIFEPDEEEFHTPVPRPHPYFIFCDKGFKPKIDEKLCPKHCTSSASQLPVIIVNKRCIYSACDNLETFSEKVKQFIDGTRGDDRDFDDDHDYTFDVPIKCTSSDQLKHLKLESSLMQVLQEEFPNPKNVNIECCICKVPTCYCQSPSKKPSVKELAGHVHEEDKPVLEKDFGKLIESRSIILDHIREPKWESYLEYVLPRCRCAKNAKKHFEEHLPAYMRKMSAFDEPEIPYYETCSINKLKSLVKRKQGRPSPLLEPEKVESRTRDVGTQYSDQEFEFLCTCFSDEEIEKLFKNLITGPKMFEKTEPTLQVMDGSLSPSYLQKRSSSFAQDTAYSLRALIKNAPEIEEIFKKEDCLF